MDMDIRKRFSQSIIATMQRDVLDAKGNEVFWVGTVNSAGLVVSIKVGARGNSGMVLVNSAMTQRDVDENQKCEGKVVIHNHPSGVLEPSNADLNVASQYMEMGVGSYIVNNSVDNVYVIVEPVKPKVLSLISKEDVSNYLSVSGPLAKENPLYEERPSQINLVKQIVTTFNEGKIGIFEAGTGVGKSYAYLLPSMVWAFSNKERVVISTGTINLQQQLIEKDIPAATKIIGKKIKAVLVKGRQNYLCLRRLEDAMVDVDGDIFATDKEMIESINQWSETTSTGSRSDLYFLPSESVWSRVNSESDACMGARCPHRDNCFIMKVRKEASDANILVVNHHLLFADIESRMNGVGYDDTAVLPPYKRIVFDEAHGIEDSATSFFSETINRFKVMKQVNLLYRSFRGSSSGFLVQVEAVSTAEDVIENAMKKVGDIKEALFTLEQLAQSAMENEFTSRLTNDTCQKFSAMLKGMEDLKTSLGGFANIVRTALEGVDDDDKDIPAYFECRTVLKRIDSMVILCKDFTEWDMHDDTVFWIQKDRLPPKKSGDEVSTYFQFTQTPLDVAPLMNMGVFEPMSSVVCTSATLRTGDNFSYWMRRTGASFVESERLLNEVFESPFPYKNNVLFAVPSDAPFPDSPMYQDYVEETLPKLILASGGRTLVLFTSYESLRHAYNSIFPKLLKEGIDLYKQGDDDRFRLLENFKKNRASVLFATDSFWEGVDVPGDSLSQVIIIKLPFAVPSDPVFKARSEAVEKRGGSSFMELSVPQAVIKFRQGFGRLVRRSDDRGAIVVMDRRIVEKRYGKMFTTSVPMTRRMYNPTEEIVKAVEKLLEK